MTYDPNERLALPGDEDSLLRSIEVEFAIPVYISHDDQRRLHDVIGAIVDRPCNVPKDGVHWVSGAGCKPNWSQADAAMLGRRPSLDAPPSGEPTFDDEVFFIETASREFLSNEDRARKAKLRAENPTDGEITKAVRALHKQTKEVVATDGYPVSRMIFRILDDILKGKNGTS